MSKITDCTLPCPSCGQEQKLTVFESLNGERVPAQVERLVRGEFERSRCSQCNGEFVPEHRMLLSWFSRGLWIVMHPRPERVRFATLERGIELVMEEQLALAPPVVQHQTRGVRPRLVFGQEMLREAVMVANAGLDPALLECAKLLALRRDMQRFVQFGPIQLCFAGLADDGALEHEVRGVTTGRVVGEIRLPADALAECRASQPELELRFPDLFAQPYVSACRYLYGTTV